MIDDKRTYQAIAHLHRGQRPETRQVKTPNQPVDLVPENEAAEWSDGACVQISQELILRLIRLLKET